MNIPERGEVLTSQLHYGNNLRQCVFCRQIKPRAQLICFTVNYKNGVLSLTGPELTTFWRKPSGRSAYVCCQEICLNGALKGNSLKMSLMGKKHKKNAPKRLVKWPMEEHIIHTAARLCTEANKTCQNTLKGGRNERSCPSL